MTAAIEEVAELSRFFANWRANNGQTYDRLREEGAFSNREFIWPPVFESQASDTATFNSDLRAYRTMCLAVVAARDLLGLDDLPTNLETLSFIADRCIQAALSYAEQDVAARYAAPQDETGQPARLVVIGMGKLGGRELNFSSDVDLIFAYPNGLSVDDDADIDVAGYFRKVAQKLVQLLSETTAQGFVYRVDTRLRPFGDAGALVASLSAMEAYYQDHGREWERYAWVKARPVAGDIAAGELLLKMLRPFVYRRYLDFGTFESIREMKTMIDAQVVRADAANDIKLGLGGIREIEFIAQAFQLIRGGQEPALQTRGLQDTLARLATAGHLAPDTAATLDSDYVTLRRLENRLQMVDDQQTHDLPEDDAARARIAAAMGHDDLAVFDSEIAALRERVHAIFDRVFIDPEPAEGENEKALARLWAGGLDDDSVARVLEANGLKRIDAIRDALSSLRDQRLYRVLGDRGQRWIARLIPLLLAGGEDLADRDAAIIRTLGVVAEIVGRSNYIALLVEHPGALASLMRLCGASSWITSRIAEQPALLDTLLDRRQLYRPPNRAELEAELAHDRRVLADDDLEGQMNVLRRFQQSAVLRIAAADVTDAMPLMVVSDKLTEVAEVVLEAALMIAWQQMTTRFGQPQHADGSVCGFSIIAYGKLGGLELGYASDLDLVFVYDGPNDAETVGGERALTHQVFFTRLAQRLIHVLTTQTMAGRAYEIDMRLRPSGNAGLMVTHIEALANYQQNQAWTWEHQALVRARPVAGDTPLGERFNDVRREILARPRDPAHLAGEVQSMRDRMRAHKDESTATELDVKQMPGGLIDIEFLAQYAALAHTADHGEISYYTDAIRILESMESAGLWPTADVQCLTHAYRAYRQIVHEAALQEKRAMTDPEALTEDRERIAGFWQARIQATAADTNTMRHDSDRAT